MKWVKAKKNKYLVSQAPPHSFFKYFFPFTSQKLRTHYSKYKDESELKFVNTSAHLKSVDETQALSIELFDRMDAVNEGICPFWRFEFAFFKSSVSAFCGFKNYLFFRGT